MGLEFRIQGLGSRRANLGFRVLRGGGGVCRLGCVISFFVSVHGPGTEHPKRGESI